MWADMEYWDQKNFHGILSLIRCICHITVPISSEHFQAGLNGLNPFSGSELGRQSKNVRLFFEHFLSFQNIQFRIWTDFSRFGWDQLIIWSTNETQELKGLGCFWHTSWEKVTFLLSNLYFGCSAVPTVKGGKRWKEGHPKLWVQSSIYWNRLDWCRSRCP